MKPRNKHEQYILNLSKKLKPITEVQNKWAKHICFEHYGYRNKKGTVCLDCGTLFHTIKKKDVCPKCGERLNIINTQKRNIREQSEYNVFDTIDGYQVIRCVFIDKWMRKGKEATYYIQEISHNFIDEKGKIIYVARLHGRNYFSSYDNFNGDLEIRRDGFSSKRFTYPKQKIIPILKRNGFKGDIHKCYPTPLFVKLLTDNKLETLFKTNIKLFLYFYMHACYRWEQVLLCLRHNYTPSDVGIWMDYIDMLESFGKDINNPHYLFPANLLERHDYYLNLKREQERKERMKLDNYKINEIDINVNEVFNTYKEKYFGITIHNEEYIIKVLNTIDEYKYEEEYLNHCVYSQKYYLKPNTLVLSARKKEEPDKPIETIEISLNTYEVLQCRGEGNDNSKYHNEILKLMNKYVHMFSNPGLLKEKKKRKLKQVA